MERFSLTKIKERMVIRVDETKANEIIDWWMNCENRSYMNVQKDFFDPLMTALGDDKDKALAYLANLDAKKLWEVSGCFEDIYRKWTTDDVWDKLEELENKIKNSATNE